MEQETPWGRIVETKDGTFTIHCPDVGQSYHSHSGAFFEARYLYVGASGFATAIQGDATSEIAVLDVGLGLGYNAILTVATWCAEPSPTNLRLVSLEHTRSLVESFVTGEAPWQSNWPAEWRTPIIAAAFSANPDGSVTGRMSHPAAPERWLEWTILIGDAKQTLTTYAAKNPGVFDFVWQDPFSQQKNPELWSPTWFNTVAKSSKKSVILMTYSVSRPVRDNLAAAGWSFDRFKTRTAMPSLPANDPLAHVQKRHWLRATLPAGFGIDAASVNLQN